MTMLDYEQIDLHELRRRSHRFRDESLRSPLNIRDTYQGVVSDPVTLHKYLYGTGDPVNHIDPTGKFSTTEFVVTGGIVGLLAGMSYGVVKAARETGQWFSSKTVYYGLAYGAIGFGIGAMAGYGLSLAFGVGTSAIPSGVGANLPTIFSKLGSQLLPLIEGQIGVGGSKVAVSYLLGVATGVATGLILDTPSHEKFTNSMVAPTAFGGGVAVDVLLRSILIEGLRIPPSAMVFGGHAFGVGLFGGLVLANSFILGFTTGYYPTVAIREALA